LFQAAYYLGPRMASLLFSLHAPLTAMVGAIIFQETLSGAVIIGLSLAVLGIYITMIYRPSSERRGGKWYQENGWRVGIGLAICAVFCQMAGALIAKDAMTEIEPFYAAFIRSASAMLVFFPLFLWRRKTGARAKGGVTFSAVTAIGKYVMPSALISTVAGMTLLLAAFAYSPIAVAVIIAALSPVIYIAIMALAGREGFSPAVWVGTIIAFLGVALAIDYGAG